ncbi:hypothetical protein D9619_007991 [Psilocybe cf. subviscida]|uniref:Uncharacterized protein n=1 Tax=Psilocybe cf. subviscida TaxID=2480587 RepID=A0A8H5ESJ3_9AGAR|nr:hypothetical protein D9619_007991 [Psilocybe cf. subviscida]
MLLCQPVRFVSALVALSIALTALASEPGLYYDSAEVGYQNNEYGSDGLYDAPLAEGFEALQVESELAKVKVRTATRPKVFQGYVQD